MSNNENFREKQRLLVKYTIQGKWKKMEPILRENPELAGRRVHRYWLTSSSCVEGLGLFATTDIEKNTVLGISHILYKKEYIRTPLGGFVNHSEDSNLKKLLIDDKFYLLTKNSIKAGDELTLTYTLYNVTYSS